MSAVFGEALIHDRIGIAMSPYLSPRSWSALLVIIIAACGGNDAPGEMQNGTAGREPREQIRIGLLSSPSGGSDLVARPTSVYQLADGRFVIGDKSERNIKVVDSGLESIETIGRAGSGPGEFSALPSVGLLADSIVALQGGGTPEVRVYSTDGALIRSFSAMLWTEGGGPRQLSVVDDSLFLMTRTPLFTHGKPIVLLSDRRGEVRASFFSLDYYLPEAAIELAQYTAPFADGRDGLIWVSFAGADSVFVFDYRGTRLGAVGIPGVDGPIPTYRSVFDENGGRFQRADSTWAMDGLPTAATLVALQGNQALLQVFRFDASQGYDPQLDQGTIHLLHMRRDGQIEVEWSRLFTAGLFGRDANGHALLLHLIDSGAASGIELSRLVP